jgi:hypothetical protein
MNFHAKTTALQTHLRLSRILELSSGRRRAEPSCGSQSG